MTQIESSATNPWNPNSASAMKPFRLGEWLVLPSRNRLEREQGAVQVELRVMTALVYLASRSGEVVSREDVQQAIWGETIVNDETLTRTISRLRSALDDDPRAFRYVETIFKRGYRLIASVEPVAEASSRNLDCSSRAEPLTIRSRGFRLRNLAVPVLMGIACLVTALVVWPAKRDNGPISPATFWETIPVTTYFGDETSPAISPDGKQVAFSWNGETDGREQVWVKDLESGEVAQITQSEFSVRLSAWSSDGTALIYHRANQEGYSQLVYRSLAADAPERVVFESKNRVVHLAWSPDDRKLALTLLTDELPFLRLYLLDLESSELRLFCEAEEPLFAEFQPAFSPDGKWLAFIRKDRDGGQRIYLAPATGGEPVPITAARLFTEGMTWLPNNREIIFGAFGATRCQLLRVDIESGETKEIPLSSRDIGLPSAARRGGRMVWAEFEPRTSIYRLDLPMVDDNTKPVPIVQSTEIVETAAISNDGTRLAYISRQSGSMQIWLSNFDGSGQRQLTDFKERYLHDLDWSPDDRRLIGTSCVEGGHSVCVIDAGTGAWRLIGDKFGDEGIPRWSADGEWIYYQIDRADEVQLWRIHADGSGAEKLLGQNPVFIGETADGRGFAFQKSGSDAVWYRPLSGDEEYVLLDENAVAGRSICGTHDEGLLYYRRTPGSCIIGYLDLETAQSETLAELPFSMVRSFMLTPDRACVVFSVIEQWNSDIVMVENFQ